MKAYHPLYGEIEVPDDRDVLEGDLAVASEILAESYNSTVLAYHDVLEDIVDMDRRPHNV